MNKEEKKNSFLQNAKRIYIFIGLLIYLIHFFIQICSPSFKFLRGYTGKTILYFQI